MGRVRVRVSLKVGLGLVLMTNLVLGLHCLEDKLKTVQNYTPEIGRDISNNTTGGNTVTARVRVRVIVTVRVTVRIRVRFRVITYGVRMP